jgi:hypothetical protein
MKAETIKGDRLLPDCSEAYAIESPDFRGDNRSREVWPKLEHMSNGRVTGLRLVQHKGELALVRGMGVALGADPEAQAAR